MKQEFIYETGNIPFGPTALHPPLEASRVSRSHQQSLAVMLAVMLLPQLVRNGYT
jgi:hypothetical protein